MADYGIVARVLRTLASGGPASRTELARAHGVSAPTLTRTIQALIDATLVTEQRGEAEGRGRPLTIVSLAPGAAMLMGVKLTEDRAWVVVDDPSGTTYAQDSYPLTDPSPQAVARLIAQAAENLAPGLPAPIDRIGVSLGASVVDGRIVRVAPFLGWKDVPFAQLVSDAAGLPAHLANDVRALAYVEAWYGLGREKDPFALLTVGAGIGAGLVVGGTPLPGAHGSAGSVGHMPVRETGPQCEQGHSGCARALASTSGMLAQAREVYGMSLTFEQLVARDEAGEEAARAILEVGAHALGLIAGAITAIVDPALVVISGEAADAFIPHRDAIMRGINRAKHWSAPAPELRLRPFSFTDWARGAAAIAVEPWALSIQERSR